MRSFTIVHRAVVSSCLCCALLTAGAQNSMTRLEAHPPAGTKSVKFYVDDVQYAELTDLYSQKTGLKPSWHTAIDPAWLGKGNHELRMVSNDGATEKALVAGTAVNTAGKIWLNGGWDFADLDALPVDALEGAMPAAAQPGYTAGKWTKIFVPNSLGAIDSKWNVYEGVLGMYRRDVEIAAKPSEAVYLYLESVYWKGRAFVNGVEVGSTMGGYTPSRFEITKQLRPGKNTIAIMVDNRFVTMGDMKRINEFYWNWGGILQEVFIEKMPVTALGDLRAEGSMNGQLKLRVRSFNHSGTNQSKTVNVQVLDASGKLAMKADGIKLNLQPGENVISLNTLKLNNPRLWELEKPYLYTVKLTGDFGTLAERTGFRDVTVKGMDILLNGKVVENLQGFDRHADYPGLGRTQPSGLPHAELKMLRDKGFRFFRPAHYPTTPAELSAADELGLLVIEEVNVTGLKGAVMGSDAVVDFGRMQLRKMIERDRSHPSLIAYSVGNENLTEEEGAAHYVEQTISLGRSLDNARLYTQVTHRHTTDKTYKFQDFVCQNYYAGWYAKDINSVAQIFDALQSYAGNKPVILSEYGAEAVPGKPGLGKSTEFYQGWVADAHNRLLNNRKHFFGKMWWCSSDFWCRPNWTGGNPEPSPPFHYKSLISLDRDHKKLAWRVMFSPVRILINPHTLKSVDLGGEMLVPADKDTSFVQVVTVKEVRGVNAKGRIEIAAPAGFAVKADAMNFSLAPGEGKSFTLQFNGRLGLTTTAECIVRAIIDEDTEAQPLLITILPKPTR